MGVRKQKSGKKRAFAFTMVTVPPVFSIFVQAVPVPSICLPYGRRLKSAEKSPSTPPPNADSHLTNLISDTPLAFL
jgi:hypothetical protein